MGGDPVPGPFSKMVEEFTAWRREFEKAHPVDPRVVRFIFMRKKLERARKVKENIIEDSGDPDIFTRP